VSTAWRDGHGAGASLRSDLAEIGWHEVRDDAARGDGERLVRSTAFLVLTEPRQNVQAEPF